MYLIMLMGQEMLPYPHPHIILYLPSPPYSPFRRGESTDEESPLRAETHEFFVFSYLIHLIF